MNISQDVYLMPRVFSFASWNVRNFFGDDTRVDRVADLLVNAGGDNRAPDVFAIYEVRGAQVFTAFRQRMPTHNFFISEGPNNQEILIGTRNSISAFVTQREEFKSGIPTLRPGALASFEINNVIYSVLCLHIKADDEPRSWGLRDDMIVHVGNLKNVLDNLAGGQANLLVMGDLNTVGMNLKFSDRDWAADEELERYDRFFDHHARSMRRLAKTHDNTLWGGSVSSFAPANVDNVYASDTLQFRTFDGGSEILVRGWPELGTVAEQDTWIAQFSDHALSYGEVHV